MMIRHGMRRDWLGGAWHVNSDCVHYGSYLLGFIGLDLD